MYAITDNTIDKIKSIVRSLTPEQEQDIQYMANEYGINILQGKTFKELYSQLWNYVVQEVLQHPIKVIKYKQLSNEKNISAIGDTYNYIRNELIENHFKAYKIIEQLQPVIENKVRSYNSCIYAEFGGIPSGIRKYDELVGMELKDPNTLDDYFMQWKWNGRNKNYKDVQRVKKIIDELETIVQKYHYGTHGIPRLFRSSEYQINNLLEHTKRNKI